MLEVRFPHYGDQPPGLQIITVHVVSQGRAFFRGDNNPGRLVLDNISPGDEGLYKCRVDFAVAPTRISNILLDVIVPPEKPRIFDDIGKEVRLKLGPYRLGETVTISCEVSQRNITVLIKHDLKLFCKSHLPQFFGERTTGVQSSELECGAAI